MRGFQMAPVVKNLPAKAGDTRDVGSIPGLGRYFGVGNCNPLQDSRLGNPRTEEPGVQQSCSCKESDITEYTHTHS